MNSTDWRQVQLDYPERFDGLNTYDQAKLSNEIAFSKLRDNPFKFIVHYVFKIFQAIKNPGIYTFRFTEYFPDLSANFFLILFFITPVLYKRNSKMHLFFGFYFLG